jgi:glycerol dehydrogenase-like iron-containing ADH family enzyme
MTIIPMPRPPLFTVKTLEDLALGLEDAQARLMGAHAAHHDALGLLSQNKHTLEVARAQRLAVGVEGKNAEQRDALLRDELSELYTALTEAELDLTRARLELALAQLAWDLLRYQLRAFEVAARLTLGECA